MKVQSTTMLLIIFGVVLSQSGVGINFGGMALWKLLLGLGLGSWMIYNGSNIARLLG
ncbi:MAG: hypothetical protein ABEJ99_04375 [Candidatus Nanohaloarchaea archaeon]